MSDQSWAMQVRYSLTRANDGFLLSLWEETPTTSDRIKPFLFKARHFVSTRDDARQILSYYLNAYQDLSNV